MNRLHWNVFGPRESAGKPMAAGPGGLVATRRIECHRHLSFSVGWARPGQSTSAPYGIIRTAVLSSFIP